MVRAGEVTMTAGQLPDQEPEDATAPAGSPAAPDSERPAAPGLAWASEIDLGELVWALTDGNPRRGLRDPYEPESTEADQAEADQEALLEEAATAREEGRTRTVTAG